MRSQGRIRKAGGEGGEGGGGSVRFRSDTKSGKGGGRAACRTMIYILVCKHVRGEWSGGEEGGISYEWGGGGGGGGGQPPPPPSQAYAGSGAGECISL